jgi:hypothetical protein
VRKLIALTVVVSALGGAIGTSTANAKYHTGITAIKWANAYCESGGDPYNKHNSTYRGKWQFDQTTWDAFAPQAWKKHDPATVPEAIQDWTALHVTYDAWPNC